MKLSYRDKVIFICAIVVIILVAGFFLFIKPKYGEMNSAKAQLKAKESEWADIEAKINTLPDLVTQLKALAEQVEDVQEPFLNDVDENGKQQAPYQNEQFIKEILDSCNLEIVSMETTYTAGLVFDEYMVPVKNVHSYDLLMQADLYNELPQEVYDDYNGVKIGDGSEIVIGITDLTIGYKDTFELDKLFNFIDKIAEDERTMSILSVSSGERGDAEVNETEGDINMRLYSIYKLNTEQVAEESDEVEIVPVEETPAA
ncbi:MAG: hypothetical protein ACI4JF_09260 [Oscillospiraceae bacterium]